MAQASNKGIYLAALALLVAGLGLLFYFSAAEGSTYFANVSEALRLPEGGLSKARLFGVVDAADLEGGPGTMGATFRLLDKDDPSKSIMVTYKGAVPDTFKAGVDVIVEGGRDEGASVFTARTLMTKCPSKYEKIRDEEKQAQSAS